MKHSKIFLLTVFITFCAFSAVIYTSCQKDPQCSNVCLNGSSCTNGACRCLSGYYGLQCQYTKIVYRNNTYTNLRLSVGTQHITSDNVASPQTTHDTIIYIKANQTAEYYGLPKDSSVATAYTYGPFGPTGSSQDVIFGETINWNTNKTAFAKNGTVFVDFDVNPVYFFLQINNEYVPPIGSSNIVNIDVNPDLTASFDTIPGVVGIPLHYSGAFTVVNDSFSHNVGYFGNRNGTRVVTTSVAGTYFSYFPTLLRGWDQSYLVYVY